MQPAWQERDALVVRGAKHVALHQAHRSHAEDEKCSQCQGDEKDHAQESDEMTRGEIYFLVGWSVRSRRRNAGRVPRYLKSWRAVAAPAKIMKRTHGQLQGRLTA